jgi:RNA polymerase sigma-70 factor (ECF subfamily)
VRGFIRVWRRGDDRVDDLTHEFFEEILGRRGLVGADPGRGKFRSFLLGAVKHFLGRVSERERALKRGGGVVAEGMEAAEVVEEPGLPPDAAFDRGWALALLARALGELERQMGEDGRAEQFAVLKPWLTGDAGRRQVEAAEALGMTETAVKVAIHRLRARFRGVVRAELAATLVMPEQVDEELGHLMAALQ